LREVGFNQKHDAAREIPASYYRKIKLTDLISSMLKNLIDYRFQKKINLFGQIFSNKFFTVCFKVANS